MGLGPRGRKEAAGVGGLSSETRAAIFEWLERYAALEVQGTCCFSEGWGGRQGGARCPPFKGPRRLAVSSRASLERRLCFPERRLTHRKHVVRHAPSFSRSAPWVGAQTNFLPMSQQDDWLLYVPAASSSSSLNLSYSLSLSPPPTHPQRRCPQI